jgi:hypothetical protein
LGGVVAGELLIVPRTNANMKISDSQSSLGDLLGSWGSTSAQSSEKASFYQQLASAGALAAGTTASEAGSQTEAGGSSGAADSETGCSGAESLVSEQGTGTSSGSGSSAASAPAAGAATAASAASGLTARARGVLLPTMSVSELAITPATPGVSLLTARELWDTDLEQRSMDAVHTELAKMGLGSANVQMVYWEEMCWYPGGNFPARTITVQTPNGGKADFDAGLTLLTPHVTARDVACLLRGAPMEG